MIKTSIRMAFTCMAVAVCMTAFAETFHVAPSGSDAASGGADAPFKTIARAVAAASSGDSVKLAAGEYLLTEPVVVPNGVVLSIGSESADCRDVVVDGQGKTACFVFLTIGENMLQGITVRGGVGGAFVPGSSTLYAGGIFMAGGSVAGCRVTDCHTTVDSAAAVTIKGGGISIQNGETRDCVVDNCSITNINSATTISTVYGGGIYTSGSLKDSIVSNCEIYVEYPNCASFHVVGCAGGGVMFESSSQMTNCVVANCRAVAGTGTGVGCGGGVAMFASGNAVLSDTLVHGCVASRSGGGIVLRSAGVIRCCTVSNNTVIVAKRDSSGGNTGGGIQVDDYASAARTIENCLICDNTITNSVMVHGDPSGGGAIGIRAGTAGTPVTVRNCILRGNIGFNGGAILANGGKGTTVSNCWMSANSSLRRGGFAYATLAAGIVFEDCRMDGHYACWVNGSAQAGQLFTRHCEGNDTDNDIVFRNCFICGNNPGAYSGTQLVWIYKGTRGGHSPVRFEQCTLADNLGAGSTFAPEELLGASNLVVSGCALYGNGSNKLISRSCAGIKDVMKFTYSSESTNMPTDPECHNLAGVSAPLFEDPATGDYRLKAGSPLRDAGGPAAEWMGARLKNGKQDMGEGVFAVACCPGSRHGISLSPVNSHPRLHGAAPDIGCFEYWAPQGFCLDIR